MTMTIYYDDDRNMRERERERKRECVSINR